jgi:hypothetical protein
MIEVNCPARSRSPLLFTQKVTSIYRGFPVLANRPAQTNNIGLAGRTGQHRN